MPRIQKIPPGEGVGNGVEDETWGRYTILHKWYAEAKEVVGKREFKICKFWDFPGGPVVKNLPSNAGDAGSIPGLGTKIPHAARGGY